MRHDPLAFVVPSRAVNFPPWAAGTQNGARRHCIGPQALPSDRQGGSRSAGVEWERWGGIGSKAGLPVFTCVNGNTGDRSITVWELSDR